MAKKKGLSRAQIYDRIEDGVAESAFTKLLMVQQCIPDLVKIADAVVKSLRAGKKLVLFGNGGSAADAQHIAAELEGRFRKDRRALPALALTTNTSTLTAVGNDYNFSRTFARQVEAHVRKGDVVLALSTSGNSKNVPSIPAKVSRNSPRAGSSGITKKRSFWVKIPAATVM